MAGRLIGANQIHKRPHLHVSKDALPVLQCQTPQIPRGAMSTGSELFCWHDFLNHFKKLVLTLLLISECYTMLTAFTFKML